MTNSAYAKTIELAFCAITIGYTAGTSARLGSRVLACSEYTRGTCHDLGNEPIVRTIIVTKN